jgi:hypothetical protein
MFGDNQISLPINKNKNYKINSVSNINLKILIKNDKNKKLNSIITNKNLTNKYLTTKETNNKIGSIIKKSFIKNNLISKSKTMFPLNTINSKNSTLSNYFSDYKFLIQLNKNNDKSLNTIQNYIKILTKFNSKSAYSFSNNYNYKFNNSTIANNKLTKNLYTFLESAFYSMFCLISKPIFIITPDKVVIHLFYYKFSFLKKIINQK